jgi:transposase-like protein
MKKTSYSDKQKAQVALEALKGEKTINQISSQYQIHSTQIQRWKTIALENLPCLFNQNDGQGKVLAEKEKLIEELYKIIGEREAELSWLKKKLKF